MGVVSAFGVGLEALRDGMRSGTSAIRKVRRFDTGELGSDIAALAADSGEPQHLMVQFAIEAGREALAAACLAERTAVGLVLGSNIEDQPIEYRDLVDTIGDALCLRGPRILTSVACASAAAAIDLACSMLRRGDVDIVLAGGADAISPTVMAGFHVLGVLKPTPSTPYGVTPGMSVGEGAGLLVLETIEHARTRGQDVQGIITGTGLAADAHHATAPAPDGRGIAGAIRRAGAVDIGYVNGHGTGTVSNDVAEVRGITSVLGDVPISSCKGLFGHAQGASSALEIIATLLAAESGQIPPTWGTKVVRPGGPTDAVLGGLRSAAVSSWLSVSSAFGGVNAVVRFGGQPARVESSPVYVGGLDAIGPHGVGLDGLAQGLEAGGGVDIQWARELARRSDLHREDPTTVFSVVTAVRTLAAAGIRISRKNRGHYGLVVGLARTSRTTLATLRAEVEGHGLGRIRAATFARASMVSSAGVCTREVGLHGPLQVVSVGAMSGVLALVEACSHVRRGAAGMLAVTPAEGGAWEGGFGVFVQSAPTDIRVVGWAIGTSATTEEVVARSGGAGLMRVRPTLDPSGVGGLAGLVRCVERCESHGAAVLVAAVSGGLSVALTLKRS